MLTQLSGLWLDYRIQQPEDQTQFCLPLNRDTEHLYYNTYLVVDANVLTEPRVFQISKINRSNSKGIAVFTCAQDIANQHSLKADYDSDGNVIAWWADWYQGNIEPKPAITDDDLDDSSYTPLPSPTIISRITCSGKPQFKIGGSAKTFTVTYYDENNEVIQDHDPGIWRFFIDHQRVPQELLTLSEDGVKIKVKFLGDDSYIGKILTVTNAQADATASMQVEIIAL